MPCESPCFDCPFTRDADKLDMTDEQLFEFTQKYISGGDTVVEEYICEEQQDICAGQITTLANWVAGGVDPFDDLGEAVEARKKDTKRFFRNASEFLQHHEQ